MIELSQKDIEQVTGAGLLSSIVGNNILQAVDLTNAFFNAVAPIGQALNAIPFVAPVHELGDTLIGAGLKISAGVGKALGATYELSQPYHVTVEWGRG